MYIYTCIFIQIDTHELLLVCALRAVKYKASILRKHYLVDIECLHHRYEYIHSHEWNDYSLKVWTQIQNSSQSPSVLDQFLGQKY